MKADYYSNGSWFHHSFGAVYQIISRKDREDDPGEFQLLAKCYDKETPDGSECVLDGYTMDGLTKITEQRAIHLMDRYRRLAAAEQKSSRG